MLLLVYSNCIATKLKHGHQHQLESRTPSSYDPLVVPNFHSKDWYRDILNDLKQDDDLIALCDLIAQ